MYFLINRRGSPTVPIHQSIFPKKIQKGSHIRIISPSRSLKIISPENRKIANDRLENQGFHLSFGTHDEEIDIFASSSVQSRIRDLHDAFADPKIDAILTTIGGYNCVELLNQIDYDLVKRNPKIFCGYSDITALSNAIYAKTGLVTYSGLHYSSWAMLRGFDYSEEYFLKCFTQNKPFTVEPSDKWSDDLWYLDQKNRSFEKNERPWIINKGSLDKVSGTTLGGNLGLLNILQGTEYFPDLRDSVLFLEHYAEESEFLFNRGLQSLIYQKNFDQIKGIVIGKFQKGNNMTKELLTAMIKSKPELTHIPVIANVNFGHTTPIITFPIGGTSSLSFLQENQVQIVLEEF